MSQAEKFLRFPLELIHFVIQILMNFFYFNIPFQVAIGKLRLSWVREKNGWKEVPPIMEKPECWRSFATIPHPIPPDLQLQLELLSFLQNVIVYHKMDIKSAWISP